MAIFFLECVMMVPSPFIKSCQAVDDLWVSLDSAGVPKLRRDYIQKFSCMSLYVYRVRKTMREIFIEERMTRLEWWDDTNLQCRPSAKLYIMEHTIYSWNIKWKKCARMGLNGFHIKCMIGTHCNWKNQNPVSRFGATSWTALLIWPIWPNFEVNGLDWQCCFAGSSKMAPRIFIFSTVLGAENLSYVKSIETHVRAFLPLNTSAIGSVGTFLESF